MTYDTPRALRMALELGRVTIRQLRSESEVVDDRPALYIERALQLSQAA